MNGGRCTVSSSNASLLCKMPSYQVPVRWLGMKDQHAELIIENRQCFYQPANETGTVSSVVEGRIMDRQS
jgi:hypothetical protein